MALKPVHTECILINNWPPAYYEASGRGVPLPNHASLTSKIALMAFEDRFKVLENILCKAGIKVDVEGLVEAISLLHDVGKASKYYYCKPLRHTKMSFKLHEYVPSLLLAYKAHESDNVFEKQVLKLVGKVISRHHTAMRERHPQNLGQQDLGEIVKILKEFLENRDLVLKLLSELRKSCTRGNTCQSIIDNFANYLKNLDSVGKAFSDVQSVNIYRRMLANIGNIHEYKAVAGLTGVLIVADNVAASCEGRVSDDEKTPSYTSYWIRELGLDKGRLSEICKG